MPESVSHKLPEFLSPPVVETVLGAQFEPLEKMRTAHFGLFWQMVREEFPDTQDQPALQPIVEYFGESSRRNPRLRFVAHEATRPERMWLLDRQGQELIQIQVDRFIKNWRKHSADAEYPRYGKSIKPGFLRHFEIFQEFLNREGLGQIRLNQCEVTYVNHIVAGDGFTGWSDANLVFSFLGGLPSAIEDGTFGFRLPIESEGKPVGRLTVDIQPSVRESDQSPMYVMQLIARGFVGSGLEFFDLGRAAIVEAFADLTTPAMHEIWRRTI